MQIVKLSQEEIALEKDKIKLMIAQQIRNIPEKLEREETQEVYL